MIYDERLKGWRDQVISTFNLKLEAAKRGHDHVVNSTSINNFELIKMTSELINFREKYSKFEGIK